MKPLCIYHGNCADGFAAAWVVRRAFGGDAHIDFHPGFYGAPPPDVRGRDVILVDFSYKRPVLLEIAAAARTILVLDHHKTAREELEDYAWGEDVEVHFDMDRSGCMMAWDHYFPNTTPPLLLRHIQDRDLWLFKLEYTREIQANVFSYPYEFPVWDELMSAPIHTHVSDGRAIERKHHKDVAELIAVMKRPMRIGGLEVPVASLPYTLTSDAGHAMAKNSPAKVAACYWDTPGGRVFSLRSTDDGPDVADIAKTYGGGGHAHASGFTMPIGWEGDDLDRDSPRAVMIPPRGGATVAQWIHNPQAVGSTPAPATTRRTNPSR